MIDLKDIQAAAATLISAHAYFTGWTVIQDDGAKKQQREAALNDSAIGRVIEINLPVDGDQTDDGPAVSEGYASFSVEVAINPEINSALGASAVNPLEAVENVFAALFRDASASGTNRFEAMEKPWALLVYDPGLIVYGCFFRRSIVLS
jgi:hypothetical protein